MELPELHVLQRDAGACAHAQAVAGVDVGVGGSLPDAACATGGQHRHLGFEDHDLAGFHFQGHHAQHVAFGVADQVQRHPFDEEGGACPDVTLVKRVQQGVAGAVGGRTGARHGLLAQVGRVAPERTLVDGAVGVAVERHAEVLELVDDLGRLAAHELDGVLVTEPLTVSNMCQYQLSSLMLPSEAPMPPCAATVCERVGNTLESTATL